MFSNHSTVIRTPNAYYSIEVPGPVPLALLFSLGSAALWTILRARHRVPKFLAGKFPLLSFDLPFFK
ncbi:hypothetical protein Cflav_PD1411 [Pedosphaera parvula Ellin514]|uniref:Uncharacterized protein n=1 Tax=Pedosphaera parvula (strain Ellin514) TaxID=320771 RepID=B9XPI3_PEDPL|nr:hypothetical protein Cflav_PD1411 [Pedosphaera parvula Ellin514]